jgi:F420-dependent oxidoreductase-like protein
MRIGVVIPNQRATVDGVAEQLVRLEELGIDSAWMPGIPNGPDILTLLAIAGRRAARLEIGTAIVPIYPRHPAALAAQALTVNDALCGRLTLGIGVSHRKVVEQQLGLSFADPVGYMREYLSVLRPLLLHQQVDHGGSALRTRLRLEASFSGHRPPSVLLAALGDQMLDLAGTEADGFVSWMTGLTTIEQRSIPRVQAAAAGAGRPPPRVVVGLPVMVTDDPVAARARADEEFAVYGRLPSYRAMLDAEGVAGPGGVALVADEAGLRAILGRVAAMGATDFQATPFGEPDQIARTIEVLAACRPAG